MKTALLAVLALAPVVCGPGPETGPGDGPPAARCGTIAGLVCPGDLVCVDAPGGGCVYPIDPDCGGVCVVPLFCGGIAGLPCPAGQECVDDPRDDCLPGQGADCGGLCAPR